MNDNETRAAQPFVRRTRKVFYHPNGKGTGSALQLELHPAHEDTEGSVFLTMAPQRTIGMRTADDTVHPTFDWRNAVCLKLDLMDLAQILQVMRGVQESLADGKGLFHRSSNRREGALPPLVQRQRHHQVRASHRTGARLPSGRLEETSHGRPPARELLLPSCRGVRLRAHARAGARVRRVRHPDGDSAHAALADRGHACRGSSRRRRRGGDQCLSVGRSPHGRSGA